MKRKKNHEERFHPDRYKDGPKRPSKMKQPRVSSDDENLDEAFDEWMDLRRLNNNEEE